MRRRTPGVPWNLKKMLSFSVYRWSVMAAPLRARILN